MSDFKKDVLMNNYCILINNNNNFSDYDENYILYYLLDNINELISELKDIIINQKNINITKILKNTSWKATKELENSTLTTATNFINNYINRNKVNAQNKISYILIIINNNIIIIDNISKTIEDKIQTKSRLNINTNNIIKYLNDYISKIEKRNKQKSSKISLFHKPNPKPKADPKADPDADQNADPNPKPKADPKADPNPKPNVPKVLSVKPINTKADPKADPDADPNADPKADPNAGPNADQNADQNAGRTIYAQPLKYPNT